MISTSLGRSTGTDPVLVLLHGYGADEKDLAGLVASLPDLDWLSPRAPLALPGGGHAWFPITTPGDPDSAPLALATAGLWDWIDEQIGVERRVVPLGFSQGGLMASQLLRTRPQRVLAPVILGGFVQSAAQPGDQQVASQRPAVFWGRGSEDAVITAAAIARTTAWLGAHTTLTASVYPGLGHGISATQIQDVADFLRATLPD